MMDNQVYEESEALKKEKGEIWSDFLGCLFLYCSDGMIKREINEEYSQSSNINLLLQEMNQGRESRDAESKGKYTRWSAETHSYDEAAQEHQF